MSDTDAMLIQSFSDVLEQFAFLFADEDVEDLDEVIESTFFSTSITFDGPHKGTIRLIAPESICTTIAASMLGVEEEEIDTAKAEDAFKELLNVTCGKFLEDLSGPQVIYNLSVPAFKDIPRETWDDLLETADYTLIQVEMVPILLQVEMTDD